ncbi:hypothetical protein FGO68_gene404 [Halteria grandinella]|uniref:Uncharacterized protein n=1 Tax=Halteria grandinella TaxID=5974 RepID=A0A8J8T1J2_HALGN|nr:hypothetical protein FGO68_gene404 [Halteria grandinella]
MTRFQQDFSKIEKDLLPLKSVMKQKCDPQVLRNNLQQIEKHISTAVDSITQTQKIDVHYYLYSFLKDLLGKALPQREQSEFDRFSKCEDLSEALSIIKGILTSQRQEEESARGKWDHHVLNIADKASKKLQVQLKFV